MTRVTTLSQTKLDIITPVSLREYMGISEAQASDSTLKYYLDVAVSLFETLTNHIIHDTHIYIEYPHTDLYVALPHQPILEILEVLIDDRVLESKEYYYDGTFLNLETHEKVPLTVEYHSGYEKPEDIPLAVKHILMICAVDLYSAGKNNHDISKFSERVTKLIQSFGLKRLY